MKKYYDILEIKQTNDEIIIKRAYSTMVKKYNPEQNPLEFQQIREAYDEIKKFIGEGGYIEDSDPTERDYLAKAREFKLLEQYDKAIYAYEKELELEKYKNNNKAKAHIINELATIFEQKKEFDKSIEKLKEAIEIDNTSDSIYLNLGNVYKEIRKYDESIAMYNKAYEINSKENKYIKLIMDICILTNKTDELISTIKRYKSNKENKSKYYLFALNSYVEEYINSNKKIEDIKDVLNLIVEDYKNKENEESISKDLFNIVKKLYNEKYYDLADIIIVETMQISNKAIFEKFYYSIKDKKSEMQLEKLRSDNRIKTNVKELILKQINGTEDDINYQLIQEIKSLDDNERQFILNIIKNEYGEFYNKVEDVFQYINEEEQELNNQSKSKKSSKLGCMVLTLLPIGFIIGIGMYLANH